MAVNAIIHANNRGYNGATHNMYAARFMKDGHIFECIEDDGEFGGARNILQEMQRSNVLNRIVVCSRWFSGIRLGPRRFHIIGECARAAIHISNASPKSHPSSAPPPQLLPENDHRMVSPVLPATNMTSPKPPGFIFTAPIHISTPIAPS